VDSKNLGGACRGLAVIGASGAIAFIIAALEQRPSSATTNWLWVGAGICLVVALAGTFGWLLTRENHSPSTPSIEAKARNQSAALAAGRDVRAGRDIYVGTPPSEPAQRRPTPSFDLQYQPASDGWVHLILSNFAEAGTFHVDVTRIQRVTSEETTPYPIKWRGYAGEDRQVVKEALIDLAEVSFPWYDDPNSSVIIITGHGRRVGNWRGGDFLLYSFSKQDGWPVEAQPMEEPTTMSAELALYLDEIKLHVRAIRIDSGEEINRVVTIGFELPKWNEGDQRWDAPERAVRVAIEAKQ
jgi:hypothetical protein